MKIGLIDIDYNGSFPNIPLMKISAWRKSQGHTVEWYMPFGERYDVVYVSKIFSWSEDYKDVINSDQVWYGGSGYQIKNVNGKEEWDYLVLDKDHFYLSLPPEIEHIYPDYSLYPTLTKDTAYGFLTRGCPRGCSFCHVAAKEGTTIEQDLERIYTLRDMGYWAYVMIYDKEHASQTHKYLARWCNNRRIFATTPRFEDYNPKLG